MNIGWYLTVSALVFCIGAAGVLTRRSPLVILLCLELMLNGVNLAFVAFSHALHQVAGNVFVFFVMVVAAAEAAVGLAIIIAVVRNRNTLAVDELSELGDK